MTPVPCLCGSRVVRVVEEVVFARGKPYDPTFVVQCGECTRGMSVTPQWSREAAVVTWNRNNRREENRDAG